MFLYPARVGRETTFSTHGEEEPCPFGATGQSREADVPCCALPVEPNALYLTFFGMARVAARLIADKSAAEARRFALDLRATAKQLSQELNVPLLERQMSMGIPVDVAISGVDWQVNPVEAIRAIEVAAQWHEKVGKLGFAVRSIDRND